MSDHLHPAYFAVRFRTEATITTWPRAFAIITAYATTGETWTTECNAEADRELKQELLRRGCAPIRITGYDPESGHAEPGWAVEMPVEEAMDLGAEYLQDAIFFVDCNVLHVTRCAGDSSATIGSFRERLLQLPATEKD